mgnify:CR=1 FL=1
MFENKLYENKENIGSKFHATFLTEKMSLL